MKDKTTNCACPEHIPAPTDDLRAVVRDVHQESFRQNDTFHKSVRALRNRIVVFSLLAVAADGALIAFSVFIPKLRILSIAKGVHLPSSWQLMLLVTFFGCVGALVSAVPAIAAIPRVDSPFNVPLQQALLKIAAGSIAAIVGALVASTATKFTSLATIFTAAAAFGASQQVVTRYLDQRAVSITKAAPQ
jgi:hypothetical protein